jgi:hypothetical protein
MTTLAYTFADLYQEVAFYLGLGRSPSGPDLVTAQKYANAGYRRFLQGVDPRTGIAYSWNFLSPPSELAMSDDLSPYAEIALPADFESIIDDPSFEPGTGYVYIRPRSVSFLKNLYARTDLATGIPTFYCIYPNAAGAATPWSMLVWPIPDQAYSFRYRYRMNPPLLVQDADVPVGGVNHAETILAACLAVAENRHNDRIGEKDAAFKEMMAASIDADARTRPMDLGPMFDPSDEDHARQQFTPPTYRT